ncbi:3-oxoadipate enol-lactonase [Solicola sp. PLA-1-18]|uniref:3-oxoadipate enol-lactonase n=1 Tax=Solicola sp. PLA-1-18 TaxID=3380532 RepID=UPI003B7E240B
MTVALHHLSTGEPDRPAVLLGSSVGATADMWRPQLRDLAGEYQLVAFDHRGHGGSPVPPGPYGVDEMARDVLALADRLGLDRFHYVGLSLGGAVGQELALQAPDRLRSLSLVCTAATFGSAFAERAARVRAEGMGWLVETTRGRWFTPEISGDQAAHADDVMAAFAATSPEGYAASCDALARFDTRGWLEQVTTPTMVVSGSDDPATPPSAGEVLAAGIDGATFHVVEHASHLANVEQPRAVTDLLRTHLEAHA